MATLPKKVTLTSPFQKRVPLNLQIKFLRMLGELLEEGFSIKEALSYLQIVLDKEKTWLHSVRTELALGQRLDEALVKASFPPWITSQLFLSQLHGHLAPTLLSCSDQLENEHKKKQEFLRLLQYPLFLILFMVGMLLAMRYVLLPNITGMVEETSFSAQLAIDFIYYSPQMILLLLLLILSSFLLVQAYFRDKSALSKATFLATLPFVGSLIQEFYTYRFSQEWSGLLRSGLHMKEVVEIMQYKSTSPLMQGMGVEIERLLLEGENTQTAIGQFAFLKEELTFIVVHGEATGSLAKKLHLYAKDCLQNLNRRIEKIFQLIQPFLFIFIACLVVMIYAAMLLPMFDMMNTL